MTSRLIQTRQKVEHFKEYFSAVGGKSPHCPLLEAVKDIKCKRLGEATH